MLLRIAEVAVALHPDEISLLLDAASPAAGAAGESGGRGHPARTAVATRGELRARRAAYRAAAGDARTAKDADLATMAELGELRAVIDAGQARGASHASSGERVEAIERLREMVGEFAQMERRQAEGVARAALGRCLLDRNECELAIRELEHASLPRPIRRARQRWGGFSPALRSGACRRAQEADSTERGVVLPCSKHGRGRDHDAGCGG